MARKKQLSKAEILYIEGNRELSPTDIANNIDISVELVESHLATLIKTAPETAIKTKKSSTALRYMKPKDENKHNRGVIIMTPAAADVIEASADNRKSGGSSKFKNSITNIYDS